jgi:hypothetical protein
MLSVFAGFRVSSNHVVLMNIKNVSKSGAAKAGSAKPVGFTNPAGEEIVPTAPTLPGTGGTLEGDWGPSDLKLARLDLKHAVDLRFPEVAPGSYVYSRSTEDYFPLTSPILVNVLKARKGYRQNVEQGEIPLVCYTKQELAELGGTLEPSRPDLTPFSPFCECLLLIDEGAHPEWPNTPLLAVGNRKMALATYIAKGSAFKEFGSPLARWDSFQRIAKKEPRPLWVQVWNLGSMLRKLPSFSFWVPTLKEASTVSKEEAEALKELGENL